MVALVVVAVLANVLHPIAWTRDELRFAIGAPIVVGRARAPVRAGTRRRGRAAPGRPDRVTPIELGLLAFVFAAGAVPGVPGARAPGLRAARRAARARRPDRRPRAACRPAARLAPPRCGLRPAGRLAGDRPAGHPGRAVRRLVPAVGGRREPPDRRGLARRAHRPDAARPHRLDVPLPQQPDSAAPGVVAVVGVDARPEAGLVLRGGLRGSHLGVDLRLGQPRRVVAGHPGHGLRGLAGLPATEPGAGPHRDRLRRPVDLLGADRPRARSSTTTTRRCRSCSWPSPTSWPSCGTGRRAGRGCSRGSSAAAAVLGPFTMWLIPPAAVRGRPRRRRSTRTRRRARRSSPRSRSPPVPSRSRSSSGVGVLLLLRELLKLTDEDDGARRATRPNAAGARPWRGWASPRAGRTWR